MPDIGSDFYLTSSEVFASQNSHSSSTLALHNLVPMPFT